MSDLVCCPFCLSTNPDLVGTEKATGKVCRDAFHCPIPDTHGNPHRYCMYCAWSEGNPEGWMP